MRDTIRRYRVLILREVVREVTIEDEHRNSPRSPSSPQQCTLGDHNTLRYTIRRQQ
jgi:hypothetical protein